MKRKNVACEKDKTEQSIFVNDSHDDAILNSEHLESEHLDIEFRNISIRNRESGDWRV